MGPSIFQTIQQIATRCSIRNSSASKYNDYISVNDDDVNHDDNNSNININTMHNYIRLPYITVRNRIYEVSHSMILPRILFTTTDSRRGDHQTERIHTLHQNTDDHSSNNYDQNKIINIGIRKDRDVIICGNNSSFAYVLFD